MKSSSFLTIWAQFLFILFCAVIIVPAQNAGVLRGKVADANGAAISGAEVVAQRSGVRFERVTVTDGNGDF